MRMILTVMCCIPFVLSAQTQLTCEIDVKVHRGLNRDEVLNRGRVAMAISDFILCDNPIEVTQKIYSSDYDSDTISLYLEKTSFFQFFNDAFFKGLKVIQGNILDEPRDVDFTFNGKELKFPFRSKDCEYTINYVFQSDFMFIASTAVTSYFVPYRFQQQSWYFKHPNLELRQINFNYPEDEVYIFVSHSEETKEESLSVDLEQNIEFGVNFYLLQRKYYDRKLLQLDSMDVYIYNYTQILSDTIEQRSGDSTLLIRRLFPSPRDMSLTMDSVLKALPPKLEFLSEMFGSGRNTELHIVEAELRRDDESKGSVSWGWAERITPKAYLICVDSGFFHHDGLLHEIIHGFLDASKFDSKDFFMGESMVEYVAVCLAYSDPEEREEVFQKKKILYLQEYPDGDPAPSIFELEDNFASFGLDTNAGTYLVVYNNVPHAIHELAKQTGEVNFMELLKRFYQHTRFWEKVRFEDLEKFLLDSGEISESDWNQFKNSL